ncbi:transposase [Paenibacillus lautus]|uniref:transposase n=1 Tax=Paenibacillus lautus TaxID=1401 RepID=UPI003D2D2FFC
MTAAAPKYRDGERYDAPAFIQFLDTVLQAYPIGKIVMILDNGKIHHAAQVQMYSQQHSRLVFFFLPKYSPELNLVEGLWKWLKSDVGSQCILQGVLSIRVNIASFMRRVNIHRMETIDRL